MQLRLRQRLLAGRRDALVLFDEMEDLLAQPDFGFLFNVDRRGGSKVHLHRLLETNPVQTLWTTNSISRIDPALLRRVTFALELRQPPQQVRARIWARLSDKHRMKLDPALQDQLARESEDAPALTDTALLRVAKRAAAGYLQAYLAQSFGGFRKVQDVVWCSPLEVASEARRFHTSQVLEYALDGSSIVRFPADGMLEMCWQPVPLGRSGGGIEAVGFAGRYMRGC